MAFVYVTHQGATIRRKSESLIVEADDHMLAELEVHRVETLCLFGRVHLTLPAIELLLRRNVETAFLTIHGRLKGQLTPARPSNITLRLKQFTKFGDPAVRLEMARAFVAAKLANGREVLRRFAYNHPGTMGPGIWEPLGQMIPAARSAESLSMLRGVEGMGSRAYFAGLAAMNRSDLPFEGRSSRPPLGPVNAVLSFGYVLLGNEIQHLLDAVGLDPYLGFYHEPADRRASLAVDLIEELRHPLIDRFVLTELNRRTLQAEDFQSADKSDQGTRLTAPGLKKFLARYDRWMRRAGRTGRPAPREVVRRQTERLAAWLRSGETYVPYAFEA